MINKKRVLPILCFLFLGACSSFLGENICFGETLPLPGKSIANTKLQYDTLMPVYSSVGVIVRNCNNMSVINTEVTRQPYGLVFKDKQAIGGKWEEVWTVKACSKTVNVPIKFSLDPTGASYSISVRDIKEINK